MTTRPPLEALKEELIEAERLAVDEQGKVLGWTGAPVSVPPPAVPLATDQEQPPLSYTPSHLAEKIFAGRAALAGERKQVTVLFADLKDSTELIRGLDPEAAQQLLDPTIHRMMDSENKPVCWDVKLTATHAVILTLHMLGRWSASCTDRWLLLRIRWMKSRRPWSAWNPMHSAVTLSTPAQTTTYNIDELTHMQL